MSSIDRRTFIRGVGSVSTLAVAPQVVRAKPEEHDVIVVGAGLSGLHAARMLEAEGLDVLVIEGRKRVGGRVYTLMEVPGRPEAAGEWIGGNYARMIDTATELDLELFTPEGAGPDREWVYHIGGEYIGQDDWKSHANNPLPDEFRELLPSQALRTIANHDNPLAGEPLDAWLEDRFQQYDVPFDKVLRERGYSQDVIDLMNVTIHTGHISRTSALHEFRRYHVNEFNSNRPFPDGISYKQIRGGNSLMPTAMAGSLREEPRLGKTVVHFEQDAERVTVHCADGSSFSAPHVVCSIPMPVLRDITFAPQLPALIHEAVQQINYGVSIQVRMWVKKNFWELDELPASMWSDGPLERFALTTGQTPADGSSVVAFINGDEAHKFRLMEDDEIYAYVETELAKMRPSTKGAFEPLMIQSCDRDRHGAGDWVYWAPGQVTRFGNHVRQAHGRIHFCGEHTAIMERGMEGAFESGERAALDILFS